MKLNVVEERVINWTHVYRLLSAGAALMALEWRKPRE